jgi:hypothetical protein
MRNLRLATFVAAVIVFVLQLSVVSIALAAGRDAFEGTWTITVTPADGGKGYDDTLTFTKGTKLTSAFLKKHGFDETEYDPDTRGGQVQTFTATSTSKKEGTAKWTGTAAAGQLQGTLTWTKADGSVVEYSYTGTRAGK